MGSWSNDWHGCRCEDDQVCRICDPDSFQPLPEYRDSAAERFAIMQGWFVDLYNANGKHEAN